MCIDRTELRPGAYIRDSTGLYRVDRIKQATGYAQVVLEDALSPLTSERIEDPEVPGRLGRSVALRPRERSLALNVVRERFELIRHGPHPEDTAGELEWGKCGSE